MMIYFSLILLFFHGAHGFFLPFSWKVPLPFKIPVPVPTEKERFFILPPPFYYPPRTIPSGPCVTDSKLEGTCLSKIGCNTQGGTPGGSCAGGVCCIFERTCGGSSKADVTYFKSPSYPQPFNAGLQCALTITKETDKICQLRIDFRTFNISQPTKGECKHDFLAVGDENVPNICGQNKGQHIYVNFDPEKAVTHISVDTSASTSFNRFWDLRVKQIPCYSKQHAPAGCLQYYDSTSGTVSTFNYGKEGQTKSQLLANLNYGVCVASHKDYCSLEWSADPESFNLASEDPEDYETSTETATEKGPEVKDLNCTSNFVVIPHPYEGEASLTTDRFCGDTFSPIKTLSKPFVLTVVTAKSPNSQDTWTDSGFKLNFRQLSCKC